MAWQPVDRSWDDEAWPMLVFPAADSPAIQKTLSVERIVGECNLKSCLLT
jgi:hypothetical protein